MTVDKKEKLEKFKCNPHSFLVTGWMIKGGANRATTMRCTQCLMPVSVEQLESQEWKDSQGI